jgi:hypothetical protein
MDQLTSSDISISQAVSNAAKLGVSELAPQSFGQTVIAALAFKETLRNDGTEVKFSPASRDLASTLYARGLPSIAGASTQGTDSLNLWSIGLPFLAAIFLTAVYFYLSRRKVAPIMRDKSA